MEILLFLKIKGLRAVTGTIPNGYNGKDKIF